MVYGQTFARNLCPIMSFEQGSAFIDAFFENQSTMLPLVPQNLFNEQRLLYYATGIVKPAYSLSLEYAIFAFVSRDLETADLLGLKAKIILDAEITVKMTTLGSVRAAELLGWQECGSDRAGHYCAMEAGLSNDFGLHRDPSNYLLTEMATEELEMRRFVAWGFFIFDRQPIA